MEDVFPTVVVTVVGAFLIVAATTGLSQQERRWVGYSFVMHVAFGCIQVPLTLRFFGGGDMFVYLTYGEALSGMMERDPIHAIPEVTGLLFHQRPNLPLHVLGAGTGTGTMSGLAGWTFYLLGPSRYAACVAFAIFSLIGKIGIYRVFRANVDPGLRWLMAIAALFVPSFVFWSSGVLKEAVVVGGFGWTLFGLHLWIREGRAFAGWALMAVSAIPVLLIKPYVVFPLALAGGSWYYWARSLRHGRVRIRPFRLAVGAVLGLGGIVLLGQYFPDYSLESFAEQSASLQRLGHRGGSAFTLTSDTPTTLIGQFAYAPAALLTSLFRPFIFEVHNVPSFVSALETTVLTLLFVRVLFGRNLGRVRDEILGSPFLVFCVVFVVAFGVAVGLSTSNLGTLSRYRSPLLPFLAALLLSVSKPFFARSVSHREHASRPVAIAQPPGTEI